MKAIGAGLLRPGPHPDRLLWRDRERRPSSKIYSKDECVVKLRKRMSEDYAPRLAKCMPELINEKRVKVFGALLDASYNAGWSAVCKSRMAQSIHAGRWADACIGFNGWFVSARDRKSGKRIAFTRAGPASAIRSCNLRRRIEVMWAIVLKAWVWLASNPWRAAAIAALACCRFLSLHPRAFDGTEDREPEDRRLPSLKATSRSRTKRSKTGNKRLIKRPRTSKPPWPGPTNWPSRSSRSSPKS
jgi:GH24 family phage-related lysozyme (muramidase)